MAAESLSNQLFEDFIQSELFTFHVGQDKKPFVVHAKAVTATSPVFESLIDGGLKESQDRSAEIEDVDPETFIRFLEYAYRHDYTIPSWTQDTTTIAETKPNDSTQHDFSNDKTGMDRINREVLHGLSNNGWSNSKSAPSDYGAIASTKSYTKHNKNQMGPRAAFSKRQYRHPAHDNDDLNRLHPQFDPVANTSPSQNFAPVLMAHARLYTFADMRMAQRLKDLVLHKLHKTLVTFELFPERLGDVAELVRYAYEHGEDRSEGGRIDALRDMAVNFVVSEMKVLGKCAEFRELMDAGGEFAGDFWDIVSQ